MQTHRRHGSRPAQPVCSPSTGELPGVAKAVNGRMLMLIGGGFRCGTDVLAI